MKFILFFYMALNSGAAPSLTTQEFESLEACQAASERVMKELRGVLHTGVGGSRAWCASKN